MGCSPGPELSGGRSGWEVRDVLLAESGSVGSVYSSCRGWLRGHSTRHSVMSHTASSLLRGCVHRACSECIACVLCHPCPVLAHQSDAIEPEPGKSTRRTGGRTLWHLTPRPRFLHACVHRACAVVRARCSTRALSSALQSSGRVSVCSFQGTPTGPPRHPRARRYAQVHLRPLCKTLVCARS